MATSSQLDRAHSLVLKFTVAAAAIGAVPVPGASAAIVAENGAMMAAVADAMGVDVELETVVKAVAAAGSVNMIGRALFVEGARAMGWFAGPFGVAGVSALGASTAALQTWVLGHVAIAICNNGGRSLSRAQTRRVIDDAHASFDWSTVKRRARARA